MQVNSLDSSSLYQTCFELNANQKFMKDYIFLYKIGALCDLFLSSNQQDAELLQSIRVVIFREIETIESIDNLLNSQIKSAFLFASLNSNTSLEEENIEVIDNIKNKAYRIAISLYYFQKFLIKEDLQKAAKLFNNTDIIYSIFTRLGILTGIRNNGIEGIDKFNFSFRDKFNFSLREAENRFSFSDLIPLGENNSPLVNKILYLSDFQKNVMFESLLPGKSIVLSAPTSAGKTFILIQFILFKILHAKITGNKINIAFIVPTKALIAELRFEFNKLLKDNGIENDVNIITHLSADDYFNLNISDKINLFILTQERLNYIYSDLKLFHRLNLYFELIVIDEAHKVSYGYRGILLNYIIDAMLQDGSIRQVVFLTPLLRNLAKGKSAFGLDTVEFTFSNFGLVAKNFYILKKEGLSNWNLCLKIDNEVISLFSLKHKKLTQPKYLAYFAKRFTGDQDSSLVYRRYPSDTIDQSIELAKDSIAVGSDEISHLISYLKNIISENFPLIDLISKGIAYHNGQLPYSVKVSIENIYKNYNSIKFLSVNATVLEGVNLPAKNIFIGADVKDNKNFQISSLDVKNLIGRAGRLNYHMSGNVFMFDYNEYKEKIGNLDSSTEQFEGNIEKLFKNTSKFDSFIEYLSGSNYKNGFAKNEKKTILMMSIF